MELGNIVINLHGQKLAVGMIWQALPDITSLSKEVAQICRDAGDARFGVIVTGSDAKHVGLHASSSKVASGAAWVALGSKGEDIVLLEPVGEDSCWICAVRNGAPHPGFDLVVAKEDVAREIDRLAKDGVFKISSTAFEGADLNIGFEEITKGKKAPQLKQLIGVPRELKVAAVAVVGIAAVAGGALFYSQYVSQRDAQEALSKVNASQAENQKRQIEAARLQALAAAESMVKLAVASAPSPGSAVSAWMGSFENLPTSTAGWSLAKVTCDMKVCLADWKRTKFGTTTAFLSAAADSGWKVSSYFAGTAQIMLPVTIAARNGNPQDMPAEAVAMPDILTQLQSMALAGVDFTIAKPDRPHGAPTPQVPAGVTLSDSPWKLGHFLVSGKRIFDIRDVPDYIERNNITLSTLSYDADTQSWTMEGNYAVK